MNEKEKSLEGLGDLAKLLAAKDARIAELERDAERYQYLRNADVKVITKGGIFAGKTPDNIVMNGDDLDNEIDAAIRSMGEK